MALSADQFGDEIELLEDLGNDYNFNGAFQNDGDKDPFMFIRTAHPNIVDDLVVAGG